MAATETRSRAVAAIGPSYFYLQKLFKLWFITLYTTINDTKNFPKKHSVMV